MTHGSTIDALLAGTLPDPDGGPPLAVATRAVAIASSLDGDEADLVRSLALGRRLAVISDSTTHGVLGARVERALDAVGSVDSIVLAIADGELAEQPAPRAVFSASGAGSSAAYQKATSHEHFRQDQGRHLRQGARRTRAGTDGRHHPIARHCRA